MGLLERDASGSGLRTKVKEIYYLIIEQKAVNHLP
jgi:hypothetical protein